MRVINLASGSKGNSTLIEHNGTSILIDAGLAMKELELRLKKVGASLDKISAIIVSHNHDDHIRSVAKIANKFNITVYSPIECFYAPKLSSVEIKNRKNIELDDFYIGDIKIETFEVSHDALKTIGFVFYCDGNKVGLITDLGCVDELILSKLVGSNLIMIESNYDEQMLLSGPYPLMLKRRILSQMGHLSNFDCADAIVKLSLRGTKHFMLMHLSETNNSPEIAYNTVMRNLYDYYGDNNDVRVMIAEQYDVSPNFLFKHREEGDIC